MNFNNLVKYDWRSGLSILLFTSIIWAQPLSGGARVPSVILMLLGIILLANKSFAFTDLRWRRLLLLFSLFWVPALISVIGSYEPENSAKFIVLLPLFLLYSVTLFYVLDTYLSQNTLFLIITAICSFWLIDASIQFFFDVDLFGVERYGDRIVGPFKEHLRLGLFISVLLPIVLSTLARYGWMWQLIYLLMAVAVVMLTGVRTDLLTMIIAVTLYVIASKKYNVMLAMLPIIVVAGLFAGSHSEISQTKIKTFSSIPTTYTEWNQLSSYRLDLWSTAWSMLRDNPVNGVGVRCFSAAYNDYSSENNIFHGQESYHAHHPIISIAAETGSIGLLGLLGVVFLLYRWGRNHTKNTRELLLANPWLQIVILLLFPIQSMPLLFSLWWFPFVAFVLVCYLHSINSNVTRTENKF